MQSMFSSALGVGFWLSFVAMTARGETPRTVTGLTTSPAEVCPLPLGSTIPTVILKTAKGEDFTLAPDRPSKPRILIFYRGGW